MISNKEYFQKCCLCVVSSKGFLQVGIKQVIQCAMHTPVSITGINHLAAKRLEKVLPVWLLRAWIRAIIFISV